MPSQNPGNSYFMIGIFITEGYPVSEPIILTQQNSYYSDSYFKSPSKQQFYAPT